MKSSARTVPNGARFSAYGLAARRRAKVAHLGDGVGDHPGGVETRQPGGDVARGRGRGGHDRVWVGDDLLGGDGDGVVYARITTEEGSSEGLGECGWKGDELAGGASGRAADRRGADAGEAAREHGDEETELDTVGVQRRRDEGGGGRDEHPEGGREDEVGEVGEEMPKEGEEPREPTEDAVAEGPAGTQPW